MGTIILGPLRGWVLGKTRTAEAIAKMRAALSGENNPRGALDKIHSVETLAKIRTAKGAAIFVYDTNGLLVNTFSSARKNS